MMKKSYVWALLASLFMVGCSQNDDLPENPGEDQKVEKEWSYMAINVNAAPSAGSRAGEVTDGGFAAGDENESAVYNACFFFFDDNGTPFNVISEGDNNQIPGNGTNGSAGKGGGNWVIYSYGGVEAENGNANVEQQLPVVLTLSGIKNSYPTKMVAVLNWTPTKATTESYSLDELKSVLLVSHLNDDDKFIMSNSVYKSNGTPSENVYATQLTQRNFAKSPTDAKNNPVDIYVERVAAKVTVDIDLENGNKEEATFGENEITAIKVGETGSGFLTLADLENINVYAKIDGWDINTTINQSYLLKSIEGNNSYTLTNWNQPAYFRSYWATIPTNGTTTYTSAFDYDEISNSLGNSDYCLENTSQEKTTKVIVKATIGELEGSEGNKVFKPLPLAYWMGTYYRVDDLKEVVANLLSDELYYNINEAGWKKIDFTDGGNMPGVEYIGMGTMDADENSYKVIFKYIPPTDNTISIKWSFDGTNALTGDVEQQLNAKLNALAPARVWNNGQTYYIVPIQHATVSSDALYGVIRNHVYQINITGVVGLGTPVFGDVGNIEEPLVPIETDTYLAARINVLSWKVVGNNVTLGE